MPPRRAARSLTWAVDSSPVTRIARRPVAEIAPSAVRSSVDLPTPGSPPTSTRLAGTSPPPSTRSSSGTPVGMRCASSALTSTRRKTGLVAGLARPQELLDEGAEGVAARALAEPAPGGVAALRTRVVDCCLGHALEASRAGGRERHASASERARVLTSRGSSRPSPDHGQSSCSRTSPARTGLSST